MDGSGLNILSRDIRRAYDGEEIDAESYTGVDVALDEMQARQSEEYIRAREYYGRLLGECETDSLPTRDVFDKTPRQGWLTHKFRIDEKTFKAFRREAGVSTTAFFTGVMGFLAAKYNYRENSVIATIYNGQKSDKTQNTLSMLVKTLPFVTDLSENPAIRDVLKKATEQLAESRENDLYSFAEIAAEYGVTADISFGYQGRILEYQLMDGAGIQIERIYDEKHIENTAILIELSDFGEGRYGIHMGYRADMFSRGFAENMAHAYAKAAQEFLTREHVILITD